MLLQPRGQSQQPTHLDQVPLGDLLLALPAALVETAARLTLQGDCLVAWHTTVEVVVMPRRQVEEATALHPAALFQQCLKLQVALAAIAQACFLPAKQTDFQPPRSQMTVTKTAVVQMVSKMQMQRLGWHWLPLWLLKNSKLLSAKLVAKQSLLSHGYHNHLQLLQLELLDNQSWQNSRKLAARLPACSLKPLQMHPLSSKSCQHWRLIDLQVGHQIGQPKMPEAVAAWVSFDSPTAQAMAMTMAILKCLLQEPLAHHLKSWQMAPPFPLMAKLRAQRMRSQPSRLQLVASCCWQGRRQS